LFIDTSHHYEQTLAELNLYGPKATMILLHDTELEDPYMRPPTDPLFPVRTAIDDWCAKTGRQWTNRTGCYGLGVIEG
jgi:cephalosporin hydroxylase